MRQLTHGVARAGLQHCYRGEPKPEKEHYTRCALVLSPSRTAHRSSEQDRTTSEARRRRLAARRLAYAVFGGLLAILGCRNLLQIEELKWHDAKASAGAGHGAEAGGGGEGGERSDARSVAPTEPHASCRDLPGRCGPIGEANCCEIAEVADGKFNRANDLTAPATVTGFALDRFEVTVGRFRRFVDAGYGTRVHPPSPAAGAHPSLPESGWNLDWDWYLPANSAALRAQVACSEGSSIWTDTAAAAEYAPMNCLDWYVSFAFCAWDGGRLPTEAEWNYAAAGGDEQRAYPWGQAQPDSEHASYACLADGSPECSLADFVTVGSLPAGNARWGHADLAGGIYEWMLDSFAEFSTPCNNCATLIDGAERVLRGGAFSSGAGVLRNTWRQKSRQETSSSNVGVRCARPPGEL